MVKRCEGNDKFQDGLPIIKSLNENYEEIPIIILSHADKKDYDRVTKSLGAQYFLSKKEFNKKEWKRIFLLFFPPK